jgi:hypothetical protein
VGLPEQRRWHLSVRHYTNGSYDGNGDGDTSQVGLINVAALNGNLDGNGNGSSFLNL